MDDNQLNRGFGDAVFYHPAGVLLIMPKFSKHNDLSPHHRYQLEIILLFALGAFLFFTYYLILEALAWPIIDYQWYFFVPFTAFYIIYSLFTRGKIGAREIINVRQRHLVYWILFGLTVIFLHLQPSNLNRLLSFDIMFAVFSLFLADSYWDFKKIKFF